LGDKLLFIGTNFTILGLILDFKVPIQYNCIAKGSSMMNYDTKIAVTTERDYKVVKANEIIQKARYNLNITELKILAYILSKIKPADTELQEYTFSIKDYCQVCGIDYKNGGNYEYIKLTLKGMRDKSFWIQDETGAETTVGWLGKVRINKGSGKVKVKLDEDMHKYVIGLFDNYTQYELLSTLPMKSAYSFRIYELLKSYAFTKHHTFDIDDLKRLLAAENYINFKDFRKKVIEIAVKEINLYTDLEVSWEAIKKGRKVIQVKFSIVQRDTWGKYMAANRASAQIEGQISILEYNYYK
jgi:plasmid replication initiation protein